MKIAYIFMKYPTPVQPYAISDVSALEAAGHVVDVYALSGKHKDHRQTVLWYNLKFNSFSHPSIHTILAFINPKNVNISCYLIILFLRNLFTKPDQLIRALVLTPRLVEIAATMRRDPPEVVHAFWGHFPSLMILLAARYFPTTYRSMFLGNYDLTSQFFSLSPKAAAISDVVWTIAHENLPLLSERGIDLKKVRVAIRGIPSDLADGPKPNKTPGLICTAANFQKEKNLDLVLRSFARVARTRPDARLIMVGDGDCRDSLEALARELGVADRTIFTGLLSRKHVFEEMAKSEIFIFLSTKASERMPNVVSEAMLAQCHCIVSKTPGIENLISDGENGEVVDVLEPENISSRIIRSLSNPEYIRASGRAAASHIRTNFSTETLMQRYVDVWRQGKKRKSVELKNELSDSGNM